MTGSHLPHTCLRAWVQPPPPPPPAPGGCPALHTASLTCVDLSLLATYLGLLALGALFLRPVVARLRWAGVAGQGTGCQLLSPFPKANAAAKQRRGQETSNPTHEDLGFSHIRAGAGQGTRGDLVPPPDQGRGGATAPHTT